MCISKNVKNVCSPFEIIKLYKLGYYTVAVNMVVLIYSSLSYSKDLYLRLLPCELGVTFPYK